MMRRRLFETRLWTSIGAAVVLTGGVGVWLTMLELPLPDRPNQTDAPFAAFVDQVRPIDAGIELPIKFPESPLPDAVSDLRDSNRLRRVAALWKLEQLAETAYPVVGAVIGALRDEDSEVRDVAGLALFAISPCHPAAVDALVASARSVHREIRGQAQFKLEYCLVFCSAALPDLLPHFEDRNPDIRRAVVRALREDRRRDPRVTDLLLRAVTDEDDEVREIATKILPCVDGTQHQIVEALLRLADDKSPQVRIAAARSLACRGAAAKPAIQALVRMLSDDRSSEEIVSACYALSRIDPGHPAARDSLKNLVQSPKAAVRRWAGYAMDPAFGNTRGYYVTSEMGGVAFVSRQHNFVIGIQKIEFGKDKTRIQCVILGDFDWENVQWLTVADDGEPPRVISVNLNEAIDRFAGIFGTPGVVTIDNSHIGTVASVKMQYAGQEVTLRPDGDVLRDRQIDFSLDLDSHCAWWR